MADAPSIVARPIAAPAPETSRRRIDRRDPEEKSDMPRSPIRTFRGFAVATVIVAAFCTRTVRAQGHTFTTFAGTDGGPGWFDGTGNEARFVGPSGIARDSSGNLYVADFNGTIRKITPSGEVSTLAGLAEDGGIWDGDGSAARMNAPVGVTVDDAGNVFFADAWAHTIRKITPAGRVSTIAGVEGQYGSDDGIGAAARFASPVGIAVDANGNLYVAELWNHTIRKISPEGTVTTLAGLAGDSGTQDGSGPEARFDGPFGVVFDHTSGSLLVSEASVIRRVTPAGVVTTIAGVPGSPGSVDGPVATARFNGPTGLALDASGNLFVADYNSHAIRKIDTFGMVTTLAGLAGFSGSADGMGSAARFNRPMAIAIDQDGAALVADYSNGVIRKVTSDGAVTTFAGKTNEAGSLDGAATSARFRGPDGVAVDSGGNLYVTDAENCTIRVITTAGTVSTLAGSPGLCGSADGTGSDARFFYPRGIAVDSEQNAYIADTENHTIRKVTPGGEVTTLAGSPGASGSNDGTGAAARFSRPHGVAVDSEGTVYVADSENHTMRRITPAGEVTTIAGLAGNPAPTDGNGADARFYYPRAVAVDSNGTVYVADGAGVRRMTPAGDVTTVASVQPQGIAVGLDGTIYVSAAETIQAILPDDDPVILAGVVWHSGSADGTGGDVRFNGLRGLAIDSGGVLYAAESANHRIRVGRTALAGLGALSIDNPAGFLGVAHHLVFQGTATSYSWRMTRRPAASSAELSSASDASPTFTPDVNDGFEFQLVASDGNATFIGRRKLMAPQVYGVLSGYAEGFATPYTVIRLTEPLDTSLSVDWATADGSAVEGLDYIGGSGSVTFAPGETSKTILLQYLNDSIDEFNETFEVRLGFVNGIQYGGPDVVTIRDDDPAPTLSIDDVSVSEGDSGAVAADFTVSLSASSGLTVSCWVTTEGGTATEGIDFWPVAMDLTFLPGETSKRVTIAVHGDEDGEPDEDFSVILASPRYATLGDSQGLGIITNDDFIAANPPTGLSAKATSTSSVAINWNPVGGATGYRVFRRSSGTGYVEIATPVGASYVDTAVTAGKSYLYTLRATDGPLESVDSAPELATTVQFTDPTFVPGLTIMKRSHVTELRTAVNSVRALAGLSAFAWTDPTLTLGSSPIRAVHVSELRSALGAARSALGLPALALTDPTLASGSTGIKAAHVVELRSGAE